MPDAVLSALYTRCLISPFSAQKPGLSFFQIKRQIVSALFKTLRVRTATSLRARAYVPSKACKPPSPHTPPDLSAYSLSSSHTVRFAIPPVTLPHSSLWASALAVPSSQNVLPRDVYMSDQISAPMSSSERLPLALHSPAQPGPPAPQASFLAYFPPGRLQPSVPRILATLLSVFLSHHDVCPLRTETFVDFVHIPSL